MPVTFPEVVAALRALQLEVSVSDELPDVGAMALSTLSFADPDGQPSLGIMVFVEAEGRCVVLAAPSCYSLEGCKYKAATFLALLQASSSTHFSRFVVDVEREAVEVRTSIAVGESGLHPSQLQAVLGDLMLAVESFHPVIAHAMQAGEVDLARRWTPPEDAATEGPSIDAQLLSELDGLVKKSGGREGFERLVQAYLAAEQQP